MRSEGSRAPVLGVRPAGPADADAVADLFLAARAAAYPAIPRSVHPDPEVRHWLATRVADPGAELWLAEEDDEPVAMLLLEGDWVHSLYVAPARTGEGLGTLLLDLAKSLRPHGLGLWVFESNHGARRFYRRHGFTQVRRTDGSDNEEGAPDLELAWSRPAASARSATLE
ncbi:MAG: GNAT family N-acetyltransferase [Nocardioidaceae bacterium]